MRIEHTKLENLNKILKKYHIDAKVSYEFNEYGTLFYGLYKQPKDLFFEKISELQNEVKDIVNQKIIKEK